MLSITIYVNPTGRACGRIYISSVFFVITIKLYLIKVFFCVSSITCTNTIFSGSYRVNCNICKLIIVKYTVFFSFQSPLILFFMVRTFRMTSWCHVSSSSSMATEARACRFQQTLLPRQRPITGRTLRPLYLVSMPRPLSTWFWQARGCSVTTWRDHKSHW